MKKILVSIISLLLTASIFSGCQQAAAVKTTAPKDYDTITMVWYPNESGEDLKAARDEFANIIAKATGKKVEHKLTTDYAIAIETIANGNAHLAFMGGQGYVEANAKNNKIIPMVVNSDKNGTLDEAKYFSWLNVNKGKEGEYKKDGKFVIDNIQGKRFSFVSNSSTSGFKVPSSNIVAHFSKMSQWKNLKAEDLLEGGKDKLFTQVLFGGSHQGSAVNLLTDKADVAAFCDTCVANYVELAEGTANRPGAIYKVKKDAAEPFNKVTGKEFVVISVTPVLNGPFAMNTAVLKEEHQKAIIDALTSEEVSKNEKIFAPKDFKGSKLFTQEGKTKFLKVEDKWYDPIRELSK